MKSAAEFCPALYRQGFFYATRAPFVYYDSLRELLTAGFALFFAKISMVSTLFISPLGKKHKQNSQQISDKKPMAPRHPGKMGIPGGG